jgi:hypothetical protein
MSNAETSRLEQREISRKFEFDLRTSLLRSDLAQAQSMLRAATWEPADVRAKVIEQRELAVQDAREALDRHLAMDRQDTSWLD